MIETKAKKEKTIKEPLVFQFCARAKKNEKKIHHLK